MDSSSNFPVLVIAIIGILATAFLLLGYYIFVIKCCLNWHRSPNHPSSDPQPAYSESAITRGLDDSLIRLIPVIRFRKEAKKTGDKTGETGDETEYLECSVCLSDFKEGEKLRVIPNCCHAFHIDCIDVWLQGNANCPVCRSCISSHTLSDIGRVSKRSNRDPGDSGRRPSPDQFTGNDDDYVVIEILHNNLDEPVLVRGSDSGDLSPISIALSPWKTEHGKQSCDDECVGLRVEEDEFDRVHPIRRSVSMDLSRQRRVCSEIREAVEQSKKQSNEGRSFFSFGGRGGSRSAVLPLQLDS